MAFQVKRLFLIPQNIGASLLRQAQASTEPQACYRLLSSASYEFSNACHAKPNDSRSLVYWGDTLCAFAVFNENGLSILALCCAGMITMMMAIVIMLLFDLS